jgi:hypothetical protein
MTELKQRQARAEDSDRLSPEPAHVLRVLSPRQIARIDRLLSELGPYGEVRLVKVKGRLRFIQRVDSEDAL